MMAGGPQLRTVEDFQRAIDDACERATAAVGAGLYLVASNIMAKAKQIAPLDFGTLSRSGYVTLPYWDGGRYGVEMGFGGFAEKYAVRQHEDPKLKNKREPGREWKYLRKPLDEAANTAADKACAYARQFFESGGAIVMPPTNIAASPWTESLAPMIARRKKDARRQARGVRRLRERIKRRLSAMSESESRERSRIRKKIEKLDYIESIKKERARIRAKLEKLEAKEKARERRKRDQARRAMKKRAWHRRRKK